VFKKVFFLLICFFLYQGSGYSQRGWELGGWIGGAHYFGDLNTAKRIDQPGLALGLSARRNFNTRVCAKSSLSFGRIGADDANSNNNFERSRNLSFRSNVFDLTTVMEFNFFNYIHGSRDHNFTPYFMAGFSIFHFNPTAEIDNVRVNLRTLGTEGQPIGEEYGSFSGGIVLGGGFKWDINHLWSLNIELSTRFLFTDYLDDVSTVYFDRDILNARRGELAARLADRSLATSLSEPGRQRGNKKDNDNYVFFGVGVFRYFGGINCPKESSRY
jgi:hypothetical protein